MKIGYRSKRVAPGRHDLFVALYGSESECLIATGERLDAGDWDEEKRLPKGKILTRASIIMAEVGRAEETLRGQGEDVTPFTVKQLYESRRKANESDASTRDKQRRRNAQGLSTLADNWSANHLFGYKHSTQKSIKESLRAFQEYLRTIGRASMQRQELTQELITKYERYLQEKVKLSNATHGKRMKHLRWFLKSLDFDTSKIKLRSFQKPIIALTLKELAALEAYDASESIEKQKAKDLFLLGCYTGQRISDLKTLRPSSIVEGEIRMKQQKTGKIISIPLLPEAAAILQRHQGSAPRIAEQHLNENIKLICNDAGITAPVEHIANKAGLDVKQDVPKWQLITSHIAGKTFISTVAPERYKLTPPEIAAVSGKNLKTLLTHYFSLPRESARLKMIQHDSTNLKVVK